MYNISLGFVTVTTAGTPIPLGGVLTALGYDVNLKVHHIEVWPKSDVAAPTYVGLADTANNGSRAATPMNKSTGAGVIKQILPPGATGRNDNWEIDACAQANSIRVADYAVDSDTSGKSLVISLVVA